MHSLANRCDYTPFCDWLTITVPDSEAYDLERGLRPLILEADGVPQPWGFRFCGVSGSVAVRSAHAVTVWSFSGEAVALLREKGLWPSVLAEIGTHPHRVTRLDVAYDTPDDAPVVLPEFEARGCRGEVHLSRKAVAPRRIKWQRSLGPCGRMTGTVYAGQRGKSRVVGRVYDKRAHLWDTTGEDPGVTWTRYELELSVPGLTLADAYAPERVFWAYGSGLCGRPVPEGVESWEAHGAGYVLPAKRERSTYEVLEARVERSEELAALRGLAETMGEAGLMALRRMVLQRLGLAT